MILETIPALGDLTTDQKLRLVWELWHDVSRDTAISAATGDLLDQRLAEHSASPDKVRTTDEVTAGIMALKQRIAASSRK
ncbi:MAG: putative addiction module component, family [Verrucomicrobiaceae bacterium]|nr:putative addiction module component, family [Verrucomicrobiaceae bacterium]